LRSRDQASARLAELKHMAEILCEAADLVSTGWLQDSWFAYLDENGRTRAVNAYNINDMAGRPVVGACLVGAIVQAGGGLENIRTQPVQRALDLTWRTLFQTPGFQSKAQPVHRVPAPTIRALHVRDLTRWNDHPDRTAPQAAALLRRSAVAAESEAAHISQRVSASV
jgi:hypothetical protein